jgi:hypothetical protein
MNDDLLFKAFHSFAVSVIQSVVESFFCKCSMIVQKDYYLSQWCKSDFSGDESLQEVFHKLPKDISTIAEYILFVQHIPLMSNLFNYFLSNQFPGFCQVNLLMSLSCLKKYTHKVYVHIEDQLSLCGFTVDSVEVYSRCSENNQMVESYKFHNSTCPFMEDLFPDLAKQDEAMEVD